MATAPVVTTPSTIGAKLRQTDGEVAALWRATWSWLQSSPDADPQKIEPIRLLYTEWRAYFNDSPSTLWGSTFDQAEAFRARLAEQWDYARSIGVDLPGPAPKPDERVDPSLFLGLTAGTIVLVLVGLVVLKRFLP